MHFRTIKSIVENETGEVFPFTVLGVVVADCCFETFLENASKETIEEFTNKYVFVSTDYVLGHADGFVIVGKFIFDVDTSKPIDVQKSEMMDDFLKYKVLTDSTTLVSDGVVYISGIQIDNADEDENIQKEPTEEEKAKQATLEAAIRKERSEK